MLIGLAAFLFYFITNLLVLYASRIRVNDPSRAINEIRELRQLDLDKSGTIDPKELEVMQTKRLNLSFGDKLLELLSTHPNMLKRIKQLSQYGEGR